MPSILVVDDDRFVRRTVRMALKEHAFLLQEAKHGNEAIKLIDKRIYDIIICDLRMEGPGGLDVLRHAKRVLPDAEFILMTAYGTIGSAVEAMKNGAYDYITKPFEPDELLRTVLKALERNKLRMRVRALERSMRVQFGPQTIISINKQMHHVIQQAMAVASTDSNVLITGESGTGKELIAGVIHNNSGYSDRPFVPVNCGGLPEPLLESELFGHVKGAFTGAVANKRGLVEEADGGTLFLDEIAEMSPSLQVKLLRFIQNGELRRLGDTDIRRVNVRIISATNKNLPDEMEAGRFREDLFYRIAVIPFHLPPLRERSEDIPLLVQHYLRQFSKKLGAPNIKITSEALNVLTQYPWPGNVRELMNAIEHGVALCGNRDLDVIHLPERILNRMDYLPQSTPGKFTLADVEKNYILKVLRETNWSQKKACKILGLSKTTLYRRLKEYRINTREMGAIDLPEMSDFP